MMIKFQGAMKDEGGFVERGPVWINPARICAIYDHTILVDGYKIRIMETEEEAIKKIAAVGE